MAFCHVAKLADTVQNEAVKELCLTMIRKLNASIRTEGTSRCLARPRADRADIQKGIVLPTDPMARAVVIAGLKRRGELEYEGMDSWPGTQFFKNWAKKISIVRPVTNERYTQNMKAWSHKIRVTGHTKF
jgi:hypothetical protein